MVQGNLDVVSASDRAVFGLLKMSSENKIQNIQKYHSRAKYISKTVGSGIAPTASSDSKAIEVFPTKSSIIVTVCVLLTVVVVAVELPDVVVGVVNVDHSITINSVD